MQAEENQNVNIEGVVDSILFTNPSYGYIVLELDAGDKFITVVGLLGNIEVGEELALTGHYTMHPRFGSQFCADVCTRKLPETSAAILKYLSSGVIKGIGTTLAKRIVDEFGEKTLDIIENEPEKLVNV